VHHFAQQYAWLIKASRSTESHKKEIVVMISEAVKNALEEKPLQAAGHV